MRSKGSSIQTMGGGVISEIERAKKYIKLQWKVKRRKERS